MALEAAWIAVISALGASFLTTAGGLVLNIYQARKENRKDLRNREWSKEDQELERSLKQRSEKFSIYNAVLKEDGQHRYVYNDEEKAFKEFDRDKYKDTIRPVIFTNLHLLDLNVIKVVRRLDGFLFAEQYYGTWEEWLDEMSEVYLELIKVIEEKYETGL